MVNSDSINKSPQLEGGYTRIANELLEAISPYPFTGGQLRLLLVILRNSYGYSRKSTEISLNDLSYKTNLTRRHVSNILKSLKERSVIIVTKSGRRNTLAINKDYSQWKLLITEASRRAISPVVANGVSPQ